MPTLVDPDLEISLGARSEETPRLLHYYDGFYWLVCFNAENHRVQVWKISSSAGASFVAESSQIQGNRTNQSGWEQIDSAPHWNLDILPALRIGYIKGPTGNPPLMVFAGFDMVQEEFEFYDIGPLAGVVDIGSKLYSYYSGEGFKPIKVGVLPTGVNSSRTFLLFGDDPETIVLPQARARLQDLNEGTGVLSSVVDVAGLTGTGQNLNSLPRAMQINPVSRTSLDIWITQFSAAGTALFHNYVTNSAQGTPSRLTPYWPSGEWIEVGTPWTSQDRQCIVYARGSTDQVYIHYGPQTAISAWTITGNLLPEAPNPQEGGGSLFSFVGMELDALDTIYAVGYGPDVDGGDAVANVVYRTQEDGEGRFGPWEEVFTSPGVGNIVSMTAAHTPDGSEVCIVVEHGTVVEPTTFREVYYHFGDSQAGALSGPGGNVGGFGDGAAYYVG